jgi:iron complex outermembrane receptor protein
MRTRLPWLSLLALLCITAFGQDASDLTQLNVDDLANIQVTSASRKPESLEGAPAAIYVLTGEAIRQAGFTTLPAALRMVPGLYVAQTNSHSWQISTRGFAGINNRKMLVLIDGRSVYSKAFGGVFWDLEDIPLELIERIEVIRGPGGTLWGASAVNGVINIVTKSADRTPGARVSTSLDDNTGYTSFVQYGGKFSNQVSYRVYGKASYWEPFNSLIGAPLPNSFGLPQGGLRADWAASQRDSISLEITEADGRYQGFSDPGEPIRAELLKDMNIAVHWKHIFSDRSSTETLAYCDWDSREGFPQEKQNTCDFEFQHSFAFNTRNSLIWGGAFSTTGLASIDFSPEYGRYNDGSGFLQYEYVVIPDHLRVLAGSKFEGNPFSGTEYQPQVRGVWTPNQKHSLWAAFSRAVRDPSQGEDYLDTVGGVTITPAGVAILKIIGNQHLQSERLKAYELGYRLQATAKLSFDLATYYNGYNNLIVFRNSSEVLLPGETIINQIAQNATAAEGGTAQTHGAELSVNWQVFHRWMLSPNISETRGSANAMANTPRHMLGGQSRVDVTRALHFDAALYHYNALPPTLGPPPAPGVPTFNRVDLGLSWRPTPQWTFGVWARNVQSDEHVEILSDLFGGTPGEVPRSVSFKLMWQSNPESN